MVERLSSGRVQTERVAVSAWRLCQHAVCQDSLCPSLGNAPAIANGMYDYVVLQPQSLELALDQYGDGTTFCQYRGLVPGGNSCGVNPGDYLDCGLCYGSTDACAIELVRTIEAAGARVLLAETWAYTQSSIASAQLNYADQAAMANGIRDGASLLQQHLAPYSSHPIQIIPHAQAGLECASRFPSTMTDVYHSDGRHYKGDLGSAFNAFTFLGTLWNLSADRIVSMARDQREQELATCSAAALHAPPSPPSPSPPVPSPAQQQQSCVCGSDPTKYSTYGSAANCFGANDVTNLEVMFGGLFIADATRAFYTRCADYDNDGTFRANDLTNMKRYYAGLLPIASHFAGRR